MPKYENFEDIVGRQTDKDFINWLRILKSEFERVYPEAHFQIDEGTALRAYDEGMSPYQCLSETHYD